MASAFFSGVSVPAQRQFDYDDANRMHAVRHDGVVAMRYLYNAMGERVHRAGSGIAVATQYDEDGKWIGDYDANGQPIQQAIWLDDLPVGLLVGAGANQKLYYIEADALGTPRVVIDPTRNVAVWRWNLADEAFGDSAPNQDVDGDGTALVFDMRFPGQRYDSATGLNYNYFRDYDPGTGRYVQSDPIGLGGGMTTYGYAEGSPLVYSDPEGLYVAQILFRLGMRYLAPKLAAGAIKRVTPRLVRGGIKRVAWHGPKQPPACTNAAKADKKYLVGPYNEQRGLASGLDAHHVGQKALLKKMIPNYDPMKAPSILVPKVGHTIKGPNGIVSRSSSGLTTPRDVLARDIRELRRIYTDAPNSQLRQLIEMNRNLYPGYF